MGYILAISVSKFSTFENDVDKIAVVPVLSTQWQCTRMDEQLILKFSGACGMSALL